MHVAVISFPVKVSPQSDKNISKTNIQTPQWIWIIIHNHSGVPEVATQSDIRSIKAAAPFLASADDFSFQGHEFPPPCRALLQWEQLYP